MADWLTRTLLSAAGAVINGWSWLSGEASATVVNQIVGSTRNRPHPWSTLSDYTSWDSLTDRTYFARHLPAATAPRMPPVEQVQVMFRRPPGGQRTSSKSTCLFPAFAQYLTDGFIRTNPVDPRRTTTNHEIDLCTLYGRNRTQTLALRLLSQDDGRRGRLKSQMIADEEFPPFLYPNGDRIADPQFDALDPTLFSHAQTTPPQAPYPPATMTPEKLATIFAVGGDRVNSTPFSAMVNTLLLREHNRIARQLEIQNPGWDDERLFQTARNIMIPIFIKIVVEDYINHITPMPFSLHADPAVAWTANWNRPNWIAAEFSLLYRWHSLMPDTIIWTDAQIALADFTTDNRPLLRTGLDAAFSAAARQPAGELGAQNTGDSLLPVEIFAVSQARLNRLDTYNHYRVQFGMPAARSFADITHNPDVANLLESLYETPDNVEFYPGLFAEDRVQDSPLPGLMMRMVAVDAFSQALTNPLLSEHVFNASTFTTWGLNLIGATHSVADLVARNVPRRGETPIVMTQPTWSYVNTP